MNIIKKLQELRVLTCNGRALLLIDEIMAELEKEEKCNHAIKNGKWFGCDIYVANNAALNFMVNNESANGKVVIICPNKEVMANVEAFMQSKLAELEHHNGGITEMIEQKPVCKTWGGSKKKILNYNEHLVNGDDSVPMKIDNIYICKCGRAMFNHDDFDTLGSDTGLCCPDCGNEKFETVKQIIDRQAKQIEKLKEAAGSDYHATKDVGRQLKQVKRLLKRLVYKKQTK